MFSPKEPGTLIGNFKVGQSQENNHVSPENILDATSILDLATTAITERRLVTNLLLIEV